MFDAVASVETLGPARSLAHDLSVKILRLYLITPVGEARASIARHRCSLRGPSLPIVVTASFGVQGAWRACF